MTKEQKIFIDNIARSVLRYASSFGIKVHSPIIAQAILESGWGKSTLAYKYHNYFGLKCGTKWTGPSVNMQTKEEYSPGTLTTITDNFRVYPDMDSGVKGYFEFIQLERYQNLKGVTDPEEYLVKIKADGYATASDYVESNMAVIRQYNLTDYDRTGDDKMTKTEKATQWMENLARDDSHGYDQTRRWGPDYDCSSAVITAWESAGVPLKKNGATYTGNMAQAMKKCGFENVTSKINLSNGNGCKRGDVLLNTWHHVAMYVGNGREVEASINEKGTANGGKVGDQTGREILIRSYRNYPWDEVWRYKEKEQKNYKLTNVCTDKTGLKAIKDVVIYDSVNGTPVGNLKKEEPIFPTSRTISGQGLSGYWFRFSKGWVNSANLTGWIADSNNHKWWFIEKGKSPVNCWKWIDKKCYCFGKDGYMLKNTYIKCGKNYCRVNGSGYWLESWDIPVKDWDGRVIE